MTKQIVEFTCRLTNLRVAEGGTPVKELCRRAGISTRFDSFNYTIDS